MAEAQDLLYHQAMEVDSITAPGMEAKPSIRSCTTCSKAKAKCVKRPGQQICERCSRLGKECHSREPVLRRRKVTKTTRAAQLEKLENKIEHLVNALSTTQAQRGFSVDHGQPSPPVSQTSQSSGRSSSMPNQTSQPSGRSSSMPNRTSEVLEALCPEEDPSSTPGSSTSSPGVPNMPNNIGPLATAHSNDFQSLGVTPSEAEILLDRYKRLMAPGMPFVVLPPKATAQQLFLEKPVLLHAIVMVAYFHDLPRQQLMVKQLMRDITERVLINNEKSIDILQGILVFVTWYHPHIFTGNQVTNLLHIAIALKIDLSIDRPPQQCGGDFKAGTMKAVHGPFPAGRVPTMEERRVLAGIFYLTSMLASSFKKIESMSWSSYLESALCIIEQAVEFESDLLLVQMVRLQHLIDETSTTETPSAPMQMYVKAFNADLDRLRHSDPYKNPNNVFLRMQYLTSEILIWELSLNDLQENKVIPLRSHLDDLYACVKAIKAFLDSYFSIPSCEYLTIPFSAYAQFAHAFICLIKIASLEIEGWDMKALHEGLSFSKVIDEAADRFEGAMQECPDGLKLNNDSFAKWATRVRWMKSVYESKFAPEGDRNEQPMELHKTQNKPPSAFVDTPTTTGVQQPTPPEQNRPPDDLLSGDFFNYLDENFWQSFAGDLDLGFPDMNMG